MCAAYILCAHRRSVNSHVIWEILGERHFKSIEFEKKSGNFFFNKKRVQVFVELRGWLAGVYVRACGAFVCRAGS